MPDSEKTDEAIAEDVQKGNGESFGLLVGRYEKKLLRYARRFLFGYNEAEDMVQEVFLKAYANIQGFDSKRSFNSWIYRIAHNQFINEIKKKGREPLPFFDPDTLFPHPVDPHFADDEVKELELKLMMEKCLTELKPQYREVMVLYYYENMDYRTISDILRIPVSTVGVRLSRAKQALKTTHQKLYKES